LGSWFFPTDLKKGLDRMSTAVFSARPKLRRAAGSPSFHQESAHPTSLAAAIERARRCLLDMQRLDGHWVAELQGDTILESEYILMMAFLGREDSEICRKAARYLLDMQMADGGWNNYPGGPADVSVSVKAYFALKLTGHDPTSVPMQRARQRILALGGANRCNSFTNFYLALLGQIPYDNCPAVPPEMMFLPRWAYFNIYAMSSWTRTIVLPLSIFYAHKPVRRLTERLGIGELFLRPPEGFRWIQNLHKRWLSWHNFFLVVDQIIKLLDPQRPGYAASDMATPLRTWRDWLYRPLARLRAAAVRRAERWMLERFDDSDGLGAIFPPMIYTVISLRCLGYADDSAEMVWALKKLEEFIIEENGRIRLQPCFSPVWDTALALNALAFASDSRARSVSEGLPDLAHAAGSDNDKATVATAAQWLLDREVRRKGDWCELLPGVEPGGWFFEYRNSFYPDTDDTAMVLMGLARTGQAYVRPGDPTSGPLPAVQRAIKWLLAMQNSDGGWAAFDRDINRAVFEKVPFADHNAMLDPSCPDITARVLEALAQFDYRVGQRAVDRAVAFIQRAQDKRGCWIGRWGVNYIYGTWQVLQGLEAIGLDSRQPMVRRAVAWLKSVQQSCGGWGETCQSYDDPALAGQGTPTASQTGWALLGLIAAGEASSPEVKTGVEYLLSTQANDGNWEEEPFTGTGFPRVFYLKYHNYRLYFPLMALARYQNSLDSGAPRVGYHWDRSE
jgi:squalene-hopene/tetraprenyl-beta-curcumene cyclase